MYGVLCLHGFTGSPKEVEPISRYLKTHTDWLIKTPILPGHGVELALKGVGYKDWIRTAEEELEKMIECCERVSICGFSMGGLLGSWLAAKYPVEKLVLLSPAAYVAGPLLMGKDFAGFLKSLLCGEKPPQMQKYKKVFHVPISAYLEFLKLARLIRPRFREVRIPTFIVQGKRDAVVPVKSAQYVFEAISSEHKRLVLCEQADHMICYCEESEKLFSEIAEFLSEKEDAKKIALAGV